MTVRYKYIISITLCVFNFTLSCLLCFTIRLFGCTKNLNIAVKIFYQSMNKRRLNYPVYITKLSGYYKIKCKSYFLAIFHTKDGSCELITLAIAKVVRSLYKKLFYFRFEYKDFWTIMSGAGAKSCLPSSLQDSRVVYYFSINNTIKMIHILYVGINSLNRPNGIFQFCTNIRTKLLYITNHIQSNISNHLLCQTIL